MAAVEIILLVCGIVCIVVSFIFDFKDNVNDSETITTELTEEQKNKIRSQINQLIDEELDNLNERTEASLDKISNIKTLELNDYAESILGQINRNHNETVFLYDMLNEKAKEVKNTVRDVNVTRRQVEKIHAAVAGEDAAINESSSMNNDESIMLSKGNSTRNTKDLAKERLTELVRKSNEKSRLTGAVKDNQANDLDKLVSVESVEGIQSKTDTEMETKATAASASTTKATSTKTSTSKAAAKTSTAKTAADKTAETKTTTDRTPAKTTTKTSTAKTTSTRRKKAAEQPDTQPVSQEAANMNIQFEKGANNNDKILRLFNMGISNKDIAKQLNLGVGEVKLVIDLYNGGK